MIILGIETSCDETAVALVRDGRDVLANVVYSQVARHAPYGGVVPEVAARAHVAVLPGLLQRALDETGLSWAAVDGVAATRGPGLATSLVIGFSAAKALSLRLDVPLLGVNHLEAHLHSVLLGPGVPAAADVLPALVLLVSGGHTCLVRLEGPGRHQLLGRTVDDAAGEALDKGAKLLGLGYPGGPELEVAARGGKPDFVRFPTGRHPQRTTRPAGPTSGPVLQLQRAEDRAAVPPAGTPGGEDRSHVRPRGRQLSGSGRGYLGAAGGAGAG
jgi:N6-L-threonylcarbamoyladenine synthase